MVVDDHPLVQQGIVDFLSMQNDIEVIATAAQAEQAIALTLTLKPDVILMDIQLAGKENGIFATERIKINLPKAQVIVLTSYHDDEFIFPAFAAGATSYLMKDIAPHDLVDAIRKSVQGQSVLAPVVAKRLLQQSTSKATEHDKVDLSQREHEVLLLVAKGLNNAEIAEKLFITVKTVRSHVSNILSKLQVRDRTQAAVFAWQQGIISE